MKVKEKLFTSVIAAAMVMSALPQALAAAPSDFYDFPSDWSQAAIGWAVENELLKGADGRLNPTAYITRAEMAAIINRALGAEVTSSLDGYEDVSEDSWYYDDLAKAVHMGILQGYDGKLSPNEPVTREQAFSVMARAYILKSDTSNSIDAFADSDKLSDWAKDSIAAMVENGYVKGTDNKIKPQEPITRAEFAQVLYSMIGSFIDKSSEGIIEGNAIVRTPGIALENITVTGDLLLADGINEQGASLDSVTTLGRVVIRGGSKSVNITNSTASDGVVVKSANEPVHLISAGSELGTIDAGSDLIIDGNSEQIRLTAQSLTYDSGNSSSVVILPEAEGANIVVKKSASIDNLRIDAQDVKVSGEGAVAQVNANADNAIISISGAKVTAAENVTGVMAGDRSVKGKESAVVTNAVSYGAAYSSSGKSSSKSSGSGSSGSGSSGGGKAMSWSISNELVENAMIADLGWSRFVVVQLTDKTKFENCTFQIDGVDVTDAFTPVTDDSSIVKWELTSLNPAELTVKDNTQGLTQEIRLSDNKNPTSPEVRKNTSPGYMIAHGPMAVWDYYLTVYDTDGAVRVEPSKTTFDIKGATTQNAPASYSPAAEISQSGTGIVEIMFNYNRDWEKEWFDAIQNRAGSVQLVSYDENQNTINSNLAFTLNRDVPHGKTKIGQILVKIGQNNFTTNGRYYVRVRSEGHDTVLVPIHIVNEKAPTLSVTAESDIRSGEDVTFVIEDMVYGIANPTYAAELTRPDGSTIQLEMINDWYQIGPYFYLYNTVDAEGVDRNKIPYKGEYTLTVHSNGFKDMSAKFTVSQGEAIEGGSMSLMSIKVDAISAATAVSTGSGTDGSGGGQQVSADVKFNADLLINAKILSEHLNIENESASAINQRWRSMTPDSVSAQNTLLGGFEWSKYYAAVSAAVSAGKYLSFADYSAQNNDMEKLTIPHAVKSVLENNLLGDIQDNGSWIGESCPLLTLVKNASDGNLVPVSKITDGESINLMCYDVNYLQALKSVNLNGNSQNLIKGTDYSLSISQDKDIMLLTINPKTQSFILNSANTIVLEADGYQKNRLRISYEKEIESISVSANKSEYLRDEYGTEPIIITVANSDGDFLTYFTEAEITTPSGAVKRVLSASMGGTSSYYYNIINPTSLRIVDSRGTLFADNGEYTITLKTADYYNIVEVKVNVRGALKDVPNEKPTVSRTNDKYYSGIWHYFLNFGEAKRDSGLSEWKNAITSVTVNGTVYSPVGLIESVSSGKYSFPVQSGNDMVMELYSKPAFKADSENTVVIKATGYEDLTFKFVIEEEEEIAEIKAAPKFSKAGKAESEYADYYRVSFKGSDSEIDAYLRAVTSVTVGGRRYTYNGGSYYLSSEYSYMRSTILNTYAYLDLTADGIADYGEATTVTVKADGYDDLTFVIDNTGKKPEKAPSATYEKIFGYPDYYRISFDTNASAYLGKITSVTSGNQKFSKVNYFSSLTANQYKLDFEWPSSAYKYLDVTAGAVGDTLTIEAKGYAPLVITIDKSSAEPLMPPLFEEAVYTDANGDGADYYRIRLNDTSSDISIEYYLDRISSVTVGGVEYENGSFYEFVHPEYYRIKTYIGNVYLDIPVNAVQNENTTVIVTANGFSDLIFNI